ncbi:protein kinase C and casein kinase substrate in neurons protein 2-like isoform X2 [Myxocyprinus asiaticus]|uniref:protein kinase C and casein kinase substrate in neurons protein 2-like isoform X2 n=1 Tax=Myxocyprinus asiaticus TaxID=70543 RepID=UPI00222145D6|nr:protein kinase C and casein kinase substrate in neurons protein 2-like isoform X2 [Myxocyprinus asiaticus]
MSDFNDSLNDVSSDSFWEVGNYKRTVKRVDDGNRLCNDLMNCIHERARIEKSYAQQLTEWSKRWRQLIEKGPQYGTVERAWCALMTEAEKVSDLHMEMKAALMGEDFEKVKNWQKDAFHKQMIGGFKETKEVDDGFRKAQKPWAKKLKEVDAMKKAYHTAFKEEKNATSRETTSKLENNNPDAQKKLQEKVEKCQQEVQKTKERYEKSLEELDKLTPQYMENMEQVFEQCQQSEDKRLRFFKELLLNVKQHLDLSTNHKYKTVYHTLEDTIQGADTEEDLKWFRSNHGPGMPMNWPQFEELSMDLNRTLSRRETKRKHNDEVTLMGISQTGDQVSKSSSSAISVEKRVDWSDEETGNPFVSSNANGNPFDEEPSSPEVSVPVRALYDYEGQEQDELSFKTGEEFTKIGEEDEQGWCKGRLSDGTIGLYPANYVESVQ